MSYNQGRWKKSKKEIRDEVMEDEMKMKRYVREDRSSNTPDGREVRELE